MLKWNSVLGILTIASALSVSSASALDLFGDNSVYVPELSRSVHVQKGTGTKEFAVDASDLTDISFRLAAPFDTSKCSEWRKAMKISDGDGDPVFYQRSQMRLQLQVFRVNPEAVAKAVGAGWTDVGSFEVSKIAVQYDWDKNALTILAGPRVKASAQQEIEQGLNSVASHLSVKNNGSVIFTVTNTLFACDLLEGYVTLNLNLDATQSTLFHIPSTMRASDIVAISQRVQANTEVLKTEDNSTIVSDSLRSLNAAGILGFQLSRQGYSADAFKNGDFLKLYSKLFENGVTSPQVLSADEAGDLVRSMARGKYDSKKFNVSQKLTLVTE